MSVELSLGVKVVFCVWLFAWFQAKDRYGRPIPDWLTWCCIWSMIVCFIALFIAIFNVVEGEDRRFWIAVLALSAFALGPIWGIPSIVYAQFTKPQDDT